VNVRHLWRQTFSVLVLAVSEYEFGRLGPVESLIIVLRPMVYIIQFYADLELALEAGVT